MEIPRTRREQYADTTRLALLEAAKEAFTRTGYQDTGIDEITRIARVTKGALYHHFRDKRAIFEALVIQLEDDVAAVVERRVDAEPDQKLKFAASIDGYLTACSEPSFRRLVIQDAPAALGIQRLRDIDRANIERLLVAPLLTMQKNGVISCPDIHFLGHIIGGVIWEAALLIGDSRNKKLHKRLTVDVVAGLIAAYADKSRSATRKTRQ